MRSKELWLAEKNRDTVKPDSSVAPRWMKSYSESRTELRNVQILKKMLEKSSQFLSSEQPCEPKSLDITLKITGVEKYPRKTCGCGQPRGHLIRVLNERSVNDGGDFCLLLLVILKSAWYHIVSETHFSCDIVDRELWLAVLARCCALKRTGTFASESKVMYFILPIWRSDVLMFHSWH